MTFKSQRLFFYIFSIVILAFSIGAIHTSAQLVDANKEAKLKEELAQNEAEQTKLKLTIDSLQTQAGSIQRDVDILNAQIKQAKLNINAKNIIIEQLGKDIGVKNTTISNLTDKTERSKEALAQLIRQSSAVERYSLPEVILSSKSVSEFFNDLYVYETLNDSLVRLVDEIRTTQAKTEVEKEDLSKKRAAEIDAKYEIETEQKKIQKKQDEVKKLLALTKQTQLSYTQVLLERSKRADEIRTALFQLRDSSGIPFAKALEYANEAYQKTGVRPAFLLAILTQETNLGKNVGTCNREGDPPSKNWRAIMPGPGSKSSRDDQSAFLKITSALGLSPENLPLSCPWGNGWGGAMGPSQFIPTTWLAYSKRVGAEVGQTMPNPWNPEHAFMASATYLADLGANNGGYTAERTAALKYYAGSNWNKSSNAFYGNQVMAKAATIQDNIDTLKNI